MNQCFTKKWLLGYTYVVSIFLANLAVSYFGIIELFGLKFPAGALFIGLCFTFRDLVQNDFGHKVWWFMLASMVVSTLSGVVLSHLPIPMWKVALASGVAFLVSEAIDWFVYTITKLNLEYRVVISNIFSGLADSALFVGIAFGAWGWLPPVYGQFIVKYLSGLLVIPLIIYFRSRQAKLVNI